MFKMTKVYTMQNDDLETKERLLNAAIELLGEEKQIEKITSRLIAERAEVSLGSINYHFQSKANLLNEAVGRMTYEIAESWLEPVQGFDDDPVGALKMLIKETSRVMARYAHLAKLSVENILMQGNFDVPLIIIPLLRAIYANQKSEQELRLIAFQLIIPMQVAMLHDRAFLRYSGYDLYDDLQRDHLIEKQVDNLINI